MRVFILSFGLLTAFPLFSVGCNQAQEGEDPTPDTIEASEYFPMEEGNLWQFAVEGGGSELESTFMRMEEMETLEGGLIAWPLTLSTGYDEVSAEVEGILLLSSGGGWVNMVGERDPATGTDSLFNTPVALGQSAWAPGKTVSSAVTLGDSSQTWDSTLEELADKQVYYGTFANAARITVTTQGGSSDAAAEWWWGKGVGPIHYAGTLNGAFALELVYYE